MTPTEVEDDALQQVERVADVLQGADAALAAYEEAKAACSEAEAQLAAARAERSAQALAASEALEAALEASQEPLKRARLALQELRAGCDEASRTALRSEVAQRRMALDTLRLTAENQAEAVAGAEAALRSAREAVANEAAAREANAAKIAELEQALLAAEAAEVRDRERATLLAAAAQRARESGGETRARALLSETEEALAAATADLEGARQRQLESSQALTRGLSGAEEEAAEAAASEALAAASEARARRDQARTLAEALRGAGDQELGAAARAAAEMADLSLAAAQEVDRELKAAREQAAAAGGASGAEVGACEALLASRQETHRTAQSDVEVASAALHESEARLREIDSSLAKAQGSQQRLLTSLARVERLREERARLLEEFTAPEDEVAEEERAGEDTKEGDPLADTSAWGSLSELMAGDDEREEEVPERDTTQRLAVLSDISGLAETEYTEPEEVVHDEAPEPEGPSFRLDVSLPGHHIGNYEFSQEVVQVGRESSCDVLLESPVVSRVHFEIRQHEGLFALVDLGTSNGTFVNGKRVEGLTLLNDGDGIGVGKYRLRFMAETQTAFDLAQRLEQAGGVELGGMTLRITPEESRRQDGAHDRIRGSILLPNPAKGEPPVQSPLGEVFLIGKDIACDLVLRGWFAPKRAALITRGYDRFTLVNVSPSGKDVSVNGEPVRDYRRLEAGDKIEIYGHRMMFQEPAEGAS